MRTRVLLVCAVVCGLCLFFVLRRTPEKEKAEPSASDAALTNQQPTSEPEQPAGGSNPQMPDISAAEAGRLAALFPWPDRDDTNAVYQWLLAQWQAPIDFYGKVVDENGNPVAGANVSFRWSEKPISWGADAEEQVGTASTRSDERGLFSLEGKRGASLSVWVSKDGYYASRGGYKGFTYALGPNIFTPDPQNPVVFQLRKKGRPEPLIRIAGIGLRTMRDYSLSPDGAPTEVSLTTGREVPAGQGDLRVEFWAGQPIEGAPWRITWSCRVSVPGGGLMQTDEEFPFLAPEQGYQAQDEWVIGTANWTEEVRKQYYVRLRDGKFGRVIVRVIGTSSPYFRMESFLNPTGSRNLEFDPAKEIPPVN